MFFVKAMEASLTVTSTDKQHLKKMLDHNNVDYVTIHIFASFLEGNGPFKNCIDKMNTYCTQPWFHWYLPHDECEYLLSTEASGTFIVRFSKSNPGHFALSVQTPLSCERWLVVSWQGTVKACFDDPSTPILNNIAEFVNYYSTVKKLLKNPFIETWTTKSWFRGYLDSSEAVSLLANQPIGTFLVRLSFNGPYLVIASLQEGGAVVQEKVYREKSRFILENQEGQKTFYASNLEEFLQQRKGFYLQPFQQQQ